MNKAMNVNDEHLKSIFIDKLDCLHETTETQPILIHHNIHSTYIYSK